MKKEVKVTQAKGKDEVPLDIVAQQVTKIGDAFKTLQASPINHKTLVDLIKINCKGNISRETIEEVLRVATNLPGICLKPQDESILEAVTYMK